MSLVVFGGKPISFADMEHDCCMISGFISVVYLDLDKYESINYIVLAIISPRVTTPVHLFNQIAAKAPLIRVEWSFPMAITDKVQFVMFSREFSCNIVTEGWMKSPVQLEGLYFTGELTVPGFYFRRVSWNWLNPSSLCQTWPSISARNHHRQQRRILETPP